MKRKTTSPKIPQQVLDFLEVAQGNSITAIRMMGEALTLAKKPKTIEPMDSMEANFFYQLLDSAQSATRQLAVSIQRAVQSGYVGQSFTVRQMKAIAKLSALEAETAEYLAELRKEFDQATNT